MTTPRRQRHYADHHEAADDGDADQPAHDGDIAVAHAVDRAQHIAHRPAIASGRASAARAHSAGLRVSALTAEISIETETATANWRNNCPLMPGMKATGTNTDSRTSVMAMIGPVISAIAFLVAVRDRQLGFLLHHALDILDHDDRVVDDDADGQHQRQQRHGVGGIADREQTANVPMIDTGTATSGMRVVRSLPRNRNTTIATSTKASARVRTTSSMVAVTNTVASKNRV